MPKPILTICALALSTALATTPALAASATNPVDCANAQTQTDKNACAAQNYQREDARLNTLYRNLLAKIDNPDHQKRIRALQHAWLQYRDLQCNYAASLYEGGSIQPMVRADCYAELTRQRNGILQNMLDDAALR